MFKVHRKSLILLLHECKSGGSEITSGPRILGHVYIAAVLFLLQAVFRNLLFPAVSSTDPYNVSDKVLPWDSNLEYAHLFHFSIRLDQHSLTVMDYIIFNLFIHVVPATRTVRCIQSTEFSPSVCYRRFTELSPAVLHSHACPLILSRYTNVGHDPSQTHLVHWTPQ